METGTKPRKSFGLVGAQPTVDGIWISWTKQSCARDSVRAQPVGDLQESSAPLSHLGMGIVVAAIYQRNPRAVGQLQRSTSDHGEAPEHEVGT
jgi:hypothetical protein